MSIGHHEPDLQLYSYPFANTSPGMRDQSDSITSKPASLQHNVSHVSRQGENFTHSPVNRTLGLMLPAEDFDPLGGHTILQVIIIIFLTGSLSLVTVVGNILVLVSFKINKALKTVNNYYLLSLAFADLTIGTLSMNLYTTYIIMDQWALGPVVCDLWLAIDYVASNASVMNRLVISFDRYFSVTRPLTYRAKRTTKRAMTMIGLAWSISFIVWAPAILLWQYIVGERRVQPNECYIQFLSEPTITFCTAIAAFYLPVTIMAILFWKIYQETEKRTKTVQGLKGSGSGNNPSQAWSQENCSGRMSYQRFGEAAQSSCDGFNNTEVGASGDQSGSEEEAGSADQSMSPTDVKKSRKMKKNEDKQSSSSNKSKKKSKSNSVTSSPAAFTIKDAAMAKRFASKIKKEINKHKNEKKANEKKAARTLSAILFAFITTWLPYNIMVLVNTFCQDCIPETLWALGYWLCYVNSTVNPMCYALCNKTFRTTFRDILMCQWNQMKNKPHFHQRKAVAFRKNGYVE
uniref:G-protein coupled receptors family 1 profile domain-containing protein n=1 Tax=Monopterus albus TaxID=43700 RepID=A0A3Q3QI89_MONAL